MAIIQLDFPLIALFVLPVIIFLLLAQGCAPVVTRNPLPANLVDSAKIGGIPQARIWGDELPPHYQSWMLKSKAELELSLPGIINTEHTYLAISGGGPRGAYGAGILVGWTESNTRPEFYPSGVDLRRINKKLGTKGRPTIYVIRNAHFKSSYKPVESKLLPIMAQSFASLIRAQELGDLFRIYFSTFRDDVDYRLAYIPSDFDVVPEEVGGLEYMKQLFALGQRLGRDGTAWHESPLDVEGTP